MADLRRIVISVAGEDGNWGGTAEMDKGVPITTRATATGADLAGVLDQLVGAVLEEIEADDETRGLLR